MKKNGDFKWVILGFAVSESLLSLAILTVSMEKNVGSTAEDNAIVFSDNPLFSYLGPHFCAFVYQILHQWQMKAVLLNITLISVNP
jgi:hypothetical protein